MTPDDYECLTCHCGMSVPDGMDPLDLDVRYCEECAIAEIERLRAQISSGTKMRHRRMKRRTDTARMKWLAGCGSDDGPVVEGFANVLDDYWSFLGDAIRERIGDDNDTPDVEGTDEDKLKAFRAMVDEEMDAKKQGEPL